MIVLKERFWRKLPLFCGVSVECCRVLHLMFGRVGRVGAWISMLGCALVLAYVLMEHEECEPFHSVFGFFAALQVLNSTFYFFCSLAVAKMGSTLKASDEAGMGSLNEALLVAA